MKIAEEKGAEEISLIRKIFNTKTWIYKINPV
jgi:hypothetical protein